MPKAVETEIVLLTCRYRTQAEDRQVAIQATWAYTGVVRPAAQMIGGLCPGVAAADSIRSKTRWAYVSFDVPGADRAAFEPLATTLLAGIERIAMRCNRRFLWAAQFSATPHHSVSVEWSARHKPRLYTLVSFRFESVGLFTYAEARERVTEVNGRVTLRQVFRRQGKPGKPPAPARLSRTVTFSVLSLPAPSFATDRTRFELSARLRLLRDNLLVCEPGDSPVHVLGDHARISSRDSFEDGLGDECFFGGQPLRPKLGGKSQVAVAIRERR